MKNSVNYFWIFTNSFGFILCICNLIIAQNRNDYTSALLAMFVASCNFTYLIYNIKTLKNEQQTK